MSSNDKGDNEVIQGTLHRFPGIYLTAEKNLKNISYDEGCIVSHRLKWGTLPPKGVLRIAQYIREGDWWKEWERVSHKA